MSQPFQSKWLSWGDETSEAPPLATAKTDRSPSHEEAEPITWRKTSPAEQCAGCRELEARGVAVLVCGTCDVRLVAS